MSKTSELEDLKRDLSENRLTRREFVLSATALGFAAAIPFGMEAEAATPKSGGTFRMGISRGSTTDTLDPGLTNDTYMQTVGFALRNCLTEINNEDQLVGELAESWESSPDAKTWHFKLRKGVEFHNGKSLEASDVVASIYHHISEDSTSVARGFMNAIQEVKADGKEVVQITLESGNADFPYILSDYHVPIVPGGDRKADWQSGVGTGGYVLENFEAGIQSSLKRNPNYWKEGHAHFDAIEALVIHDVAARVSAIRSDGIDAMDQLDLKTVSLIKRVPNLKVEETQGALHFTFSMHTDVAPYDNVDVRLALKHAIDRQAILDKILFGHGYIGNDHPIGKSNRFHASDLAQRTYDPDKAKHHLQKAGIKDLKVSLSAADAAFAGSVDAAVLYREAASPAGIDLTVVREPNDGYWGSVWNVKPWVTSYWSGRVTEDWMFQTAYAKGVPWNETHWDNTRFNELLINARTELDDNKRREMYFEMQQLCSEDGGVIVPAFQNYVWATTDKVAHHDKMSSAWDIDGIKCFERWWFA